MQQRILRAPAARRAQRGVTNLGFLLVAVVALAVAGCAAVAPQKVRVAEWSPHGAHLGCRMNLGPTGATAWMRGYQFEVMQVDPGSPADGILRPGDLLLAAGGTRFSDEGDARMILGNAIGAAEAGDGALRLVVERDNRKRNVTVPLPALGPYAETWPYNCAKSQRILHETCSFLRKAQWPNGEICSDGGMGTYLGGLLLLASDDPRFQDCARRAAYATADTNLQGIDTPHWAMGYGGMLLAEYYLATGDTNVLPRLQSVVADFAAGQMQCGSWGHSGPSAAYGAMNQAGIVCAITMSLAAECGLTIDRASLDRALQFYGRYAELGAVPYGDHTPGTSLLDDNGKNASTAVLCSLHPEWERASDQFSQSIAASYWTRETGHTGGFFSMVWGPLAARMQGADAFHTFMGHQAWHYDLARTWRGELVHLPYVEALTRFDDSSYAFCGGEFTAGGMGLAFAVPQHALRILGAPRSVFGAKLEGPLLDARSAYLERRWDAFGPALATARTAAATPEQKRWVAQLERAVRMMDDSVALTVREIDNALENGDPFMATVQHQTLARWLGAADPRVAALNERIAAATWQTGSGQRYYDAWAKLRSFTFQTWFPYGESAKRLVGPIPDLRPKFWETLLPVAAVEPAAWGVVEEGECVVGKRVFELATTDYTALRLRVQSPRNANTRITLNGVPISELLRGQRTGYAKIDLDAAALTLLRVGQNVVEVRSTSAGTGANALDLGLDGVPREHPLSRTPAAADDELLKSGLPNEIRALLAKAQDRHATVPLEIKPNPGIPERLRVGDSMTRFGKALQEVCDELEAAELDRLLRSPIGYWRNLAVQSLDRRGTEGLKIAQAGLEDPDWRVRSACCDAVAALAKSGPKREPPLAIDATAVGQRLVGLLADKNAWVRYRAAFALGALEWKDPAAAAALVEAANDGNDWVRVGALSAIDRVTADKAQIVRAVSHALERHSTAYSQVGQSLRLLKDHGQGAEELVPALVFAIGHPGEGMGSASLTDLMQKLVELDPEGRAAVPVLMKVAVGGYEYDRLQGNPRLTAVELLGTLGPRAGAARDVLQALAVSTEKRNEALRAAAQTALDAVGDAQGISNQ